MRAGGWVPFSVRAPLHRVKEISRLFRWSLIKEENKMDYINLGHTGLKVSRLCLGAMTFGRETSEEASHTMLDRFIAAGGNFIDTADAYTQGASEAIIGRWINAKPRHDLVIATKVRFGDGINHTGLSRKHILHAVDDSLRRLQTDYIDLYQLHMWDPAAALEETLCTLDGLVRAGKVRYLGISNFSGWQLQKAIETCRANHWESIACLQPLYNLLDRETEWELVPVCLNEGLGIIPWSPLRGGWLTGKFRRGMPAPSEDTRIQQNDGSGRRWTEEWNNYNNEATWNVIDTLVSMAQETGKSPAQVALNWLLQRPGVTAPILGARTLAQLEDNLGAVGWKLNAEYMARLDTASRKRLPYPYELLRDLN
jgi:aryl-alcohol dehydrogenase-like predicted oxidoreductase